MNKSKFIGVLVVFTLLCPFSTQAGVDLDRICLIESSGNPNAKNKKSGAYGAFQITQIALDDFNRENGTKIKYKNLKEECLSAHIATWLFEVRIPQLLEANKIEPTIQNIVYTYNCGISRMILWKKNKKNLPRETVNYWRKYVSTSR